MTVVIHSTDVGAPVLSNAAGSLIAILDYCLVGALGWTKPFSGVNKAVYQMPPGSNGHFLRVDDTDGANGSNARLVGYETMSSIDVGTAPFPTATQVPGGSYAYKGGTGSGKYWAFFGSGAFFHLVFVPGTTNRHLLGFGQIITRKQGDAFHSLLSCNTAAGEIAPNAGTSSSILNQTAYNSHSLCRSYHGAGAAIASCYRMVQNFSEPNPAGPSTTCPFPDPLTGGMNLSRVASAEPSEIRRGMIPGLWVVAHRAADILIPFASGDTVSGQPGTELAGMGFELQSATMAGSTGWWAIETSDTWYD